MAHADMQHEVIVELDAGGELVLYTSNNYYSAHGKLLLAICNRGDADSNVNFQHAPRQQPGTEQWFVVLDSGACGVLRMRSRVQAVHGV